MSIFSGSWGGAMRGHFSMSRGLGSRWGVKGPLATVFNTDYSEEGHGLHRMYLVGRAILRPAPLGRVLGAYSLTAFCRAAYFSGGTSVTRRTDMSTCSASSSWTQERSFAVRVEYFVEVVYPFLVGTQKPASHEQPVAEVDLAFVERVGLGGEAGIAGGLPVGVTDVERLVQRIGGEVEHDDVVSEVHVAVGVDPLGSDDILVFDDRSAGHGGRSLLGSAGRSGVTVPFTGTAL